MCAPGLIYAVYDISLYLWVIQLDDFAAKETVADLLYFNQLNQVEDYLIVIVTMAFVVSGFRKISAYLNWLKQFKGYQSMPIYKWLKSIIKWSALLGLLLMSNELLDTFSLAMDIQYYRWRFFNLFLAFVTYYLGFMGYRQDGLKVHESKVLLKNKSKRMLASGNDDIESKLLLKLDQQCLYLEPELTIKKLASDLSISSENLSAYINQKYKLSFRELINQYRIKHFKLLAADQSSKPVAILTMALDSGFNSQASFYRAFKKFEGISPKEYISQLN
jgi:AraC-like DNA-binding protein